MKFTLKQVLRFVFIGFSMIVIAVVMLINYQLFHQEFTHYIDQSFESEVSEIHQLLWENNPRDVINELEDYSQKGYFIQVSDANHIIYDGLMTYEKEYLQLKEMYAAKQKQLEKLFVDDFAIYEGSMQEKQLTVYIYRPALVSDEGLQHFSSMNASSFYVGIAAFALSLILSELLSRILVKPLNHLIDEIQKTKLGNYEEIKERYAIEEYNQLIRSFNQLNASLLWQKNRRKDASAQLSHELRTPLTAMSLMLENVQEGLVPFDLECQESLKEEVGHIQKLIEEIHDLEELKDESQNLQFEICALNELVIKTVKLYQPLILEKKISVNVQLQPVNIMADVTRLSQVIGNLLSNAIKYTPENGTIELQLSENADEVIFMIKDNGIGISKEEQKRVFERYHRSTTKACGQGIGLSVVNEIVKAHHGKILLFSEIEKGTEIFVFLPKEK